MVPLLCLFAVFLLVAIKVLRDSYVCHSSPVFATRINLKTVHQALFDFLRDNGRYPNQEEGLYALLERPDSVNNWQEGGYLENPRMVTDGWGNGLVYILMTGCDPGFVLLSLGADGTSGGSMYDKDLFSTDTY